MNAEIYQMVPLRLVKLYALYYMLVIDQFIKKSEKIVGIN